MCLLTGEAVILGVKIAQRGAAFIPALNAGSLQLQLVVPPDGKVLEYNSVSVSRAKHFSSWMMDNERATQFKRRLSLFLLSESHWQSMCVWGQTENLRQYQFHTTCRKSQGFKHELSLVSFQLSLIDTYILHTLYSVMVQSTRVLHYSIILLPFSATWYFYSTTSRGEILHFLVTSYSTNKSWCYIIDQDKHVLIQGENSQATQQI